MNHLSLSPLVNKLQQQSHDFKAAELSELEASFKPLQLGGNVYWAAKMPAVHFCVWAVNLTLTLQPLIK